MRKLIAVALLLGALGFAGQGTWLQGKAIVAQWLIAQAWEQQLSSGEQVRPWSWADTWPVAKLTAPDGSISYVLSGVSGQALAFGPGKLDNGVGPGDIGTLLLAGHQDSHFAFMQRLKTGDRLRIQAGNGEEYQYRIDSQRVVDSREERIELQHRRAELRLVTCYPFASLTSGGPMRYVVSASLEPYL